MKQLGDSFNIFIGTGNKQIDLFNNRYIEINVVDLDHTWQPTKSKDIRMRQCDPDKDLIYMAPNVRKYYPSAACFDDLRKVKLFGNWFDSEYKNFYISIDACQNTVAEPDKCEYLATIKQWMDK